jgi:hypothetical protein
MKNPGQVDLTGARFHASSIADAEPMKAPDAVAQSPFRVRYFVRYGAKQRVARNVRTYLDTQSETITIGEDGHLVHTHKHNFCSAP